VCCLPLRSGPACCPTPRGCARECGLGGGGGRDTKGLNSVHVAFDHAHLDHSTSTALRAVRRAHAPSAGTVWKRISAPAPSVAASLRAVHGARPTDGAIRFGEGIDRLGGRPHMRSAVAGHRIRVSSSRSGFSIMSLMWMRKRHDAYDASAPSRERSVALAGDTSQPTMFVPMPHGTVTYGGEY